MPDFSYQPKTINDPSKLTPNWHPAYLMQIADEETPPQWEMYKASPRMWRWIFAIWEVPQTVGQSIPELQSTPTSQKFSPPGRYTASKAFVFTQKLLGRKIEAGEHINLDPMMPFPCLVLVGRTDKNGAPIEFANILDMGPWPDGAAHLTPQFRQNLAQWFAMKTAPVPANGTPPPVAAASPAPPMQAAPPPAPAPTPMPTGAGWGAPAPTVAPTAPPQPATKGW